MSDETSSPEGLPPAAPFRQTVLRPNLTSPCDAIPEYSTVIPSSEPELGPLGIDCRDAHHRRRRFIPVSEPNLSGREKEYVLECLDSGWISSAGEFVRRFEDEFAQFCGCRHAAACSSGTAALHLAVRALGIGAGDEVIIPTFTMIATANAVAYTGAKPVLTDAEPKTFNLDIDAIERKITSRTKAIIVVHTYGHPVDMDGVNTIASKYGLYVVEDAAEAHGSTYKGQKVGTLAHCAAFSFYANKTFTTGEGGMLTTNSDNLASVFRTLRDHAFSEDRHFWHKFVGYNYRMTSLQAAVGLGQVQNADALVAAKRRNARIYMKLLADIPHIRLPTEAMNCTNTFWMFGLVLSRTAQITRDKLREELARCGIETRTFFVPIHLQPIYWRNYVGERYPVADHLCRDGLYLPSSSGLTEHEIHYVSTCLRETITAASSNP